MLSRKGLTAEVNSALPFLGTDNFYIRLFTKFSALRHRKISVILRGFAPPATLLLPSFYINVAVHPTEAQVCANWGLLRKRSLLATLFFTKFYVLGRRKIFVILRGGC